MHKIDAVLENFGWSPEGRGCSGLVFRNLNRGQHRAVHSLEGNQVTTRIGPFGTLQYGAQYEYLHRGTWAGLGGAPKGLDSVMLTSIRYFLP